MTQWNDSLLAVVYLAALTLVAEMLWRRVQAAAARWRERRYRRQLQADFEAAFVSQARQPLRYLNHHH